MLSVPHEKLVPVDTVLMDLLALLALMLSADGEIWGQEERGIRRCDPHSPLQGLSSFWLPSQALQSPFPSSQALYPPDQCPKEPEEKTGTTVNIGSAWKNRSWFGVAGLLPPSQLSSCAYPAAVILTVESEEEEESDSSETEKEDDEGIIFVARATSEVLQEGKFSGNGFLTVSLPFGAN